MLRCQAAEVRENPLLHCTSKTARYEITSRSAHLQDTGQLDVSSIFVDVDFRSTPWAQEEAEQGSADTTARILFVSESNVCRSVLAEAVTRQLLQDRGLAGQVTCHSKGTRYGASKHRSTCVQHPSPIEQENTAQ